MDHSANTSNPNSPKSENTASKTSSALEPRSSPLRATSSTESFHDETASCGSPQAESKSKQMARSKSESNIQASTVASKARARSKHKKSNDSVDESRRRRRGSRTSRFQDKASDASPSVSPGTVTPAETLEAESAMTAQSLSQQLANLPKDLRTLPSVYTNSPRTRYVEEKENERERERAKERDKEKEDQRGIKSKLRKLKGSKLKKKKGAPNKMDERQQRIKDAIAQWAGDSVVPRRESKQLKRRVSSSTVTESSPPSTPKVTILTSRPTQDSFGPSHWSNFEVKHDAALKNCRDDPLRKVLFLATLGSCLLGSSCLSFLHLTLKFGDFRGIPYPQLLCRSGCCIFFSFMLFRIL